MIELKIKKNTFKIINGWDEMTFSHYIQMMDIYKDSFSTIDTTINLIGILSDNKEKFVKVMNNESMKDFNALVEHFSWINEKEVEKISNLKGTEDNKIITIDGSDYRVKTDFENLTINEGTTVEMILQHNKNLNPLEVAFGVLFRKLDEDGNEEKFSNKIFEETILKLSDKVKLLDVIKHINFFLSGEKSSSKKDTQGFSIKQL